jgi:putative nucleotidyltransferase with HDIG domain
MNGDLEAQQNSELLGIKTRWALVAAAAALMLDKLGQTAVSGTLLAMLAANIFAHRWANPKQYERNGALLLRVLRFVDGALASVADLLFAAVAGTNLWMLGVPVLIGEALVSRKKSNVLALAGTMALARAAASQATGAPLEALISPLGFFAVGAGAALVLAAYRSRDEINETNDKRLATILECGSALTSSTDLRATMLHALKAAVLETGATCGYVLLIDDESPTTLKTEVAYGAEGDFEFPQQMEVGMGMSGYVAKMGQPVSVASSTEETEEYDGVTSGVRAAICTPLSARTYQVAGQTSGEEVFGVVTLLSLRSADAFSGEDLEMLRTVASLMAVSVANARMEERQRSTFVRTLESLATALEARDEYTRGHSQRVSEVSLMIGELMGLSTEALEELRVGTILHDIGKIGVPDAILNKKDRLDDAEFAVMKSHPVIGYEICKPLRLTDGVLLIIRNHHEKLDGSGYPDGLRGGELPLSLRIVCVADAFDAMSSKRPYRGVMEMSAVMGEMSRCAGTQFDPVVVENLKELIKTERMQDLYKSYWGAPKAEAA